jgi:hypothetical protein
VTAVFVLCCVDEAEIVTAVFVLCCVDETEIVMAVFFCRLFEGVARSATLKSTSAPAIPETTEVH